MCRAVTCKKCGKPSRRGCGDHVGQVLGEVVSNQRCLCRTEMVANVKRKFHFFR